MTRMRMSALHVGLLESSCAAWDSTDEPLARKNLGYSHFSDAVALITRRRNQFFLCTSSD